MNQSTQTINQHLWSSDCTTEFISQLSQRPLLELYIYLLTILIACEMSNLVRIIAYIKLPTTFEYGTCIAGKF